MVNIIVTGAAGRMGKTNVSVVNSDKNAKLVGAVDIKGSPFIGMDAGEVSGVGTLGIPIVDDITKIDGKADVIIDFSSPLALQSVLDYAVGNKVAVVCGTTGLKDTDFSSLKTASQKTAVVWAPNFSVGINLLTVLSRLTSRVLKQGFDVEIFEAHHRHKKDSPSGTAVKLLNAVKEEYNTEDIVYGRQGITGERPPKQIGVHAIRGGDIVGEHTVLFAGTGERIELTHKASTRETFALGALRAAFFIADKQTGLFSMEDVLDFKGLLNSLI